MKIARILASPLHGPEAPVLTVQLVSSSFESAEVKSYFTEHGIPSSASHYLDVSAIAPSAAAFLSMGTDALAKAKILIEKATSPSASLSDVSKNVIFSHQVFKILSPLDGRSEVGKFICIGMNYVDHCTEQNVPVPTVPLVFSKFGSCIVGPGDAIPRYGSSADVSHCSAHPLLTLGTDRQQTPSAEVSHGGLNASLDAEKVVTSKLDFEVELGIVIGSTVPRFTPATVAHKYIGGYTVIHDVSARDLQLEANGGQWLLGKCGDGYAPMGPVIVTLDEFMKTDDDEFAGAGDLHIECRLTQRGENKKTTVVQSSNTSNLVFSTPQIVSYLSKFMTLLPGDVIATGTPPGVGCFRKPDPLWMVDGDVVECEIEGIGVLRNIVVERLEEDANTTRETVTVEKSSSGPTPRVITKGPPPSDNAPQKQRLKETVCIVTGGARGIGYGIALRLALEGAKLVVLVDMKQDELDGAAAKLEEELKLTLGANHEGEGTERMFYGLACDVTNSDKLAELFRFVAEQLAPTNRIDVLVQAAGVVGRTNLMTHDVAPDDFDFVMNVNVKGIFNGARAVLPHMLEQGYG